MLKCVFLWKTLLDFFWSENTCFLTFTPLEIHTWILEYCWSNGYWSHSCRRHCCWSCGGRNCSGRSNCSRSSSRRSHSCRRHCCWSCGGRNCSGRSNCSRSYSRRCHTPPRAALVQHPAAESLPQDILLLKGSAARSYFCRSHQQFYVCVHHIYISNIFVLPIIPQEVVVVQLSNINCLPVAGSYTDFPTKNERRCVSFALSLENIFAKVFPPRG
mmetsp:Transcript_23124/g.46158  ORF Transcript_23124/g.46158 Transcript_23124/m.46158 type:complete len:215 (-) Transcript_23124:277-921(-)